MRKIKSPLRLSSIMLAAFFVLIAAGVNGQSSTFLNPILPGSHPDPSICRVGDDFYMVNSSFEYFPGLPIHKSKDLVNWELVGYGLHREDQATGVVNLVDVQSDGGIHAPTIRYHDGQFYIITTNVYYDDKTKQTDFVNFIITASNPAGPWSEPHRLEGAPGIDPDIFFDDDGRVWYVGTHSPANPSFSGEGEIWLQEIDLKNWKLVGERSFLWRGACGGVWAEGPHMYKKDNRYYLMIAEGGTSFNHAVMIAVSDSIRGPYIPNDRNPILTTRHISYDSWVHSTGHADLVELKDGRWYLVALGIRGDEKRASNMGRETHLVPVVWEREPFEWKSVRYEWPVVAPQTGRVERVNPVPFEGTVQHRDTAFADNFSSSTLGLEWCFRRVPTKNTFSLEAKPGFLRLYAQPTAIMERARASFIGFRQTESDFTYEVPMSFIPKKVNAEGGMALVQKDNSFVSLTVIKKKDGHYLELRVKRPENNLEVVKSERLAGYRGDIALKVESANHRYQFYYALKGGEYAPFADIDADAILSKGYTGAFLGLYATGNGVSTNDFADFDYVRYQARIRY